MSEALHQVPRTRKPRGQGSSRRGEILAAATRLFLQQGVAHATMRRIADAVGVSTAALYVYFPDKDAILQAIAEQTFGELLATLEATQRPMDSPPARFRAGMHAYVGFGLSRPDTYRLIFLSPSGKGADGPCNGVPAADHSFAVLQRDVESMMQAGYFRAGCPEATAEAIWAALHGVTTLLIDQSACCRTAPLDLIERVVEMIMNGFGDPHIVN